MTAAMESNYALRSSVRVGVHHSHTAEIIAMAEFQSSKGIAKPGSFLQIRRPLVHVPEQKASFQIFQDSFHFL